MKRILVTGASGYLGRSLCEEMAEYFNLLRLDVTEASGPGDFLLGSVTDRDLVNEACKGVDALVLAHMAPNRSDAYDWPDFGMDINVKGVAMAMEAAARNGIKRVVLISSVAVVWGHLVEKKFLTRDLVPKPTLLYGMTKALQEQVAVYYHDVRGIEVAILRPAYILREDSLINKYGENCPVVTWQCIDPRDIGQAAIRALQLPSLQKEIFYLMAGPGADQYVDVASSYEILGWQPKHRFDGLPVQVL
jgi:nucleoside-diphosphate-sugar epimerase